MFCFCAGDSARLISFCAGGHSEAFYGHCGFCVKAKNQRFFCSSCVGCSGEVSSNAGCIGCAGALLFGNIIASVCCVLATLVS